jgi:hypothetical protein
MEALENTVTRKVEIMRNRRSAACWWTAIAAMLLLCLSCGQKPVEAPREMDRVWEVEIVDNQKNIASPSIAVDDAGGVHVTYGAEGLSYARSRGGEWEITRALKATDWVHEPSVAAASPDHIGVAYAGVENQSVTVFFGDCRNGVWAFDRIGAGDSPSLAFDSTGEPLVAYIGFLPGNRRALTLARRDGAGWSSVQVEMLGARAFNCLSSLAVDSRGDSWIAYTDLDPGWKILVAHEKEGTWRRELLEEGLEGKPGGVSISVGAGDVPAVVYCARDSRNSFLRRAQRTDDTWQLSTLDGKERGSVIHECAGPAVLRDGKTVIACARSPISSSRPVERELVLAEEGDGGWTFRRIVPSVGYGTVHPAAAEGPRGVTCVAYLAGSPRSGRLRLIQASGTGISAQLLDESAGVDERVALAFDPAGAPSIAYFLSGPDAVEVARSSPSGWDIEVVDSGIGPGGNPGLAFDSGGNPAVSYCDAKKKEILVGFRAGAQWNRESLGGCADPCLTAIVFDPRDQPHVAFSGGKGLVLASFRDGSWSREEYGAGRVEDVELCVSPRGKVAVGCRDGRSMTWIREPADRKRYGIQTQCRDGRGGLSIAYDRQGALWAAYLERSCTAATSEFTIELGRLGEGRIRTRSVFRGEGPGADLSLGFDGEDHPLIAFDNGTCLTVIRETERGQWLSEKVDCDRYPRWAASAPSLAVDSDGRPAVAYSDGEELFALKFARCKPITRAAQAKR